MEKNSSQENLNKTPSKMVRLAWPKAKYGAIAAIIIIVLITFVYYIDYIVSLI